MYVQLSKIPPGRRPPKRPKDRAVTGPGKPEGLSRGLHQPLRVGLYNGLFQGFQTPVHDATGAGEEAQAALPIASETPSYGIKIRKIGLLTGETVTHTFCPEKGLTPHPQDEGRMLVLTNQRIIAFGNRDGMNETVLMPVEEIKAVAVNAGRRSKSMVFQGGLILMSGVVIYVLLAYWLTGRIDGPTIPVVRMDLVAFLVFLAIVSSVGIMSQFYFTRPDGEATFQGDGVKLSFPFTGEIAEDHIYQVVNATFAARQSIISQYGTGYSGLGVT